MPSYRIAMLLPHPIHYLLGWAREIDQQNSIKLDVLFESKFGFESAYDPTMKKYVQWHKSDDILGGLSYEFLTSSPDLTGPYRASFARRLFQRLRDERYDGIILRGYSRIANYVSILAARRTSTPILFHGETNLRSAHMNSLIAPVRNRAISLLLNQASVFLPIGSESREFYSYYGIREERMFLAPYSVDNKRLFEQKAQYTPMREATRLSWGIQDNRPVILYVGKLIHRKRPLDLLRAFIELQADAHLVMVGDGPLMPELKGFVADHHMQNVHLLGFKDQEDLPPIYAAADVFAFPSSYEPWGLVVNEAMCFGLPAVVADGVISATDLVRNGENGFCFLTGHVEALTDHLKILIHNPVMRIGMGQRSAEIMKNWGYRESALSVVAAIDYIKTVVTITNSPMQNRSDAS